MSEIEMTMEEKKAACKLKKESLAQKILLCQNGTFYTPEFLSGKTLKQLEAIYDKVVR